MTLGVDYRFIDWAMGRRRTTTTTNAINGFVLRLDMIDVLGMRTNVSDVGALYTRFAKWRHADFGPLARNSSIDRLARATHTSQSGTGWLRETD